MDLQDRFFHFNCGGIVVASLETGKFRCAERGQEMKANSKLMRQTPRVSAAVLAHPLRSE